MEKKKLEEIAESKVAEETEALKAEKLEMLNDVRDLFLDFFDDWENAEEDFFINDGILYLGPLATIGCEDHVLTLSFSADIQPIAVANMTKELLEAGFDVDVYESFYFDFDEKEVYWGEDAYQHFIKYTAKQLKKTSKKKE